MSKKFFLADTFQNSLSRLNVLEQKIAKTAAFDLQMNSSSPALNCHRISKIKDNKISGVVNGQFYNPYRDELQIALLIFENIEIGMDPEGTFYTGDES